MWWVAMLGRNGASLAEGGLAGCGGSDLVGMLICEIDYARCKVSLLHYDLTHVKAELVRVSRADEAPPRRGGKRAVTCGAWSGDADDTHP
ncbi:hypothetical protein NL676_016110 [Syzygium grande]|nr:hypothetical protein NL676_016110 [Syzygium grande]